MHPIKAAGTNPGNKWLEGKSERVHHAQSFGPITAQVEDGVLVHSSSLDSADFTEGIDPCHEMQGYIHKMLFVF